MSLYPIKKFSGEAHAQVLGSDVPYQVRGLQLEPGGAYLTHRSMSSLGIDFSDTPTLVGWDEYGMSGWRDSGSPTPDVFALFDGSAISQNTQSIGTSGNNMYISGAGVYGKPQLIVGATTTDGATYLYDANGTDIADSPLSFTYAATTTGGSLLDGTSYGFHVLSFLRTRVGNILVGLETQSVATASSATNNNKITITASGFSSNKNVFALVYATTSSPTTWPPDGGRTTASYFLGTLTTDTTSYIVDEIPSTNEFVLGTAGHAFTPQSNVRDAISEPHRGRIWWAEIRPAKAYWLLLLNGEATSATQQPTAREAWPGLSGQQHTRLYYSDLNFGNIIGTDSYYDVGAHFMSSKKITGLASSPAGLLIFGDNETLLLSGDPDANDVRIQRVSGEVGFDDMGQRPVSLGGTVFSIYKGEVWSLTLGMGDVDFGTGIENITENVYGLDDSAFTQLATEPYTNSLLGVKSGSTTYLVYDPSVKAWSRCAVSFTFSTDGTLLSGNDEDGAFLVADTSAGRVVSKALGGTALEDAVLEWHGITAGDPTVRKVFRKLAITIDDDASFVDDPTLSYAVKATNSVSGLVTGIKTGYGRWEFTFGRGAEGYIMSLLLLTFPTLGGTDVRIYPPVEIYYQTRYRRE